MQESSSAVGDWCSWHARDPSPAEVALHGHALLEARRFARNQAIQSADEQDLAADLFVRALEVLSRDPPPCSRQTPLGAWLAGMLRNLHRERLRRPVRLLDPAWLEDTIRRPGAADAGKPASSTAVKGARSLTPTQQRALALWRRGLRTAEIARRERVSRTAIMERLARVFRKERRPMDRRQERLDADVERRTWARRTLDRKRDLKPLTRRILQLMVTGRSWREIASDCGISRNAVRKRAYRLRDRHPLQADPPTSSAPVCAAILGRRWAAPPPTSCHE